MNQRDIFPRTLQYLIAISEYGSYTQAAKMLHVSQPTLSQQIKELESSLDTQLLDRSGQNVSLTDAGNIYIRFAHNAKEELNRGMRAIHDVQNLSEGSLRLGWTPITEYFACSLLVGYNRLYPGIEMSTIEMPRNEIQDALIHDDIDIGVTFNERNSFQFDSKVIESIILFEEPLYVVVGNSHPRFGQKKAITAKQLGEESLVLLNSKYSLRLHLDRYCKENKVKPKVSINTNSIRVIINIIQNSELATILPKGIAKEYGLKTVELVPELPKKLISLMHRNQGYRSPASIEFTKLALDWAQVN